MNWISVKDRLPEDSLPTWCDLILVGRSGDFQAAMPAVFRDGEFIAVTPFNNVDDGKVFKEATHWMPLPEPPEDV